jgi:Kdo2-lipid IVA lauroyltransferase/acyltransferase
MKMEEENLKEKKVSHGLRVLYISLLKGISRLPFPVMYGLSDLLAFLLHRVVRYRRKVIYTNLRLSFPEKSEKEIKLIIRKFYRYFADMTLETLKGYSISRKTLEKHITFKGFEAMNVYAEQGKSILLFGMHYCNWEWSVFAQLRMKHQSQVTVNPMRNNPEFEVFLQRVRERWGAKTVPVNKSARLAMGFQAMERPYCLALAADQRPPAITEFWTTFMNQEACFNSGVEKIARKTNQPIFFLCTRRTSRGHYEVTFSLLIENPKELSHQEILLIYVREMEKHIREAPEFYLWSHRRWKQKRPEGYVLY